MVCFFGLVWFVFCFVLRCVFVSFALLCLFCGGMIVSIVFFFPRCWVGCLDVFVA